MKDITEFISVNWTGKPFMVAEGGTFTNHSVMMARCSVIDGDYEICPRNPILSHRHLSLEHSISVVGHGDIVETQEGEWWMVLLGVRPYKGAHFNLGRETFLVPMVWEKDGWLRVDNDNVLVNSRERLPKLPVFLPKPEFFSDNFEASQLRFCWNTIHPSGTSLYSLSQRPGFLRLFLKPEALHQICTPAFIGRRQQHAGQGGYHFYYGFDDQEMLPVYENAEPEVLSSVTNEGFTGAYLGMYATSNQKPCSSYADFDWFLYESMNE